MPSAAISAGVQAVLTSNSIPHVTPGDADYASQQIHFISGTAQPSVIAQPQTPEDVAALVTACAASGQEFVVRGGGHDLGGRSTLADILLIDMRGFKGVVVSADKKTARVGGGALFSDILAELDKVELMTPVGGIGTVGYVGWSTLGGYGPYSPGLGLGVDQIVGARYVNAEGKIVEASEKLLKGIRGGGASNWGVVLELEIKVYPREEVQAGVLIYDSTDLKATAAKFFTNLAALLQVEKLPRQLYIQSLVIFFPGQGNTFMICYVWNGTACEESKAWQERIASLGPCVAQQVQTTTPYANIEAVTPLIPRYVQGQLHTASLSKYSAESIEVLADALGTMPAHIGCGFSIHSLEPDSPSAQPHDNSTFLVREPHFMVELIGCGVTQETAEVASAWSQQVRDNLSRVDTTLESTYFSLTNAKHLDTRKVWGKYLDELVVLKKEYDPQSVFKHALPPL